MQARLIESFGIAPEVRHFVFEAEGIERLDFQPGQFVSFAMQVDGKEITRAYSIASAPCGMRFELCLNRVDGGRLSPKLFAMAPGDRIAMTLPLGTFTVRHADREALLVATGTGIAPFRSILLARGSCQPAVLPSVTLLFGVRYEPGLLYRSEFEELARRDSTFQFWPTLTRPEASWTARTGRVQTHFAEALRGRTDIDVYLCGLKEMVDGARAILKQMGLDRKQIFYEKYD